MNRYYDELLSLLNKGNSCQFDYFEPFNLITLIDNEQFKQLDNLSFALGKDESGNNKYVSLNQIQNILISGTTGTGKSNLLHQIILSLIMKNDADSLQFLLVDTNLIDFNNYNGTPYLKTWVITDAVKGISSLNWVINEINKRYKDFYDCNVYSFDRYNELITSNGRKKMKNLIVLVNDIYELVKCDREKFESAVAGIAKRGPAVGVHLILVTQVPRTEIISSMIKSLIPNRIALTVASKLDSKIILDENGAEKLSSNGDMLFKEIGKKLVRIRASLVSEEEIKRINGYLKRNPKFSKENHSYKEDISDSSLKSSSYSTGLSEDELLHNAMKLALEYNGISTLMLQRRLKIGHERAMIIISEMERKGFISGPDGSSPRKILISKDEYYRIIDNDRNSIDRYKNEVVELSSDTTAYFTPPPIPANTDVKDKCENSMDNVTDINDSTIKNLDVKNDNEHTSVCGTSKKWSFKWPWKRNNKTK